MNKLIRILATGFGSGYSPYFPGTIGSALAAVFVYFYHLALWQVFLICLAGVFICHRGEVLLKQHDSPHIVFDEFCGVFIATWQIADPLVFIEAFIMFRFFDMVKPFPIKRLEALPGGWGIMADDVAAGLAARLLVALIH